MLFRSSELSSDDDVDEEEDDDLEEPLINYDEDFDDDDYASQSYFENNQFVSIYPEASEIDRFANTIIQEDFHWDLGLQMKTLEMGASYPSLKRENKFCMECRCPLHKHNYHWIEKKGLSTLRLLCEKEENCCTKICYNDPFKFYAHLEQMSSERNCPYHFFLKCMIESLYEPKVYQSVQRKTKKDKQYFDSLRVQEVRSDYMYLTRFKTFTINR